MRWLIPELQAFLDADPALRILIVEGLTDLTLWRHLVPDERRRDVAIYSVDSVEVPVTGGGNKQRVVELARISEPWPVADRLKFFADSDCDRFLNVKYPDRVSVTDGRDKESYLLSGQVLNCMCELGAGERPVEAERLNEGIRLLLRPVGLLRIFSAERGLDLPFQSTFDERPISRFFQYRRGLYTLRLEGMVDALLVEAELPRRDKAQIIKGLEEITERLSDIEDWQIIHGKDLTAFLAWYFEVPLKIAAGLMALSIAACSVDVFQHENIGEVASWLEHAA